MTSLQVARSASYSLVSGARHALVMLLPAVITVAFWAIIPDRFRANENIDYYTYYAPVARNLVAGRGLATAEGAPAIEYPPGHPIAVAITLAIGNRLGVSEAAALRGLVLFCVIWSGSVLALLARRVWGDWAAMIVVISWSTYPLTLWLTKQPNSEVPFGALLATGVALIGSAIVQPRRSRFCWTLGGLAIGASMLVRSIAIFLPFVLCAVILWRLPAHTIRQRLVACALFLVGVGAVVMPWEMWVLHRAGVVVPLSNGGMSSMKDGFTFAVQKRAYREGITVPADVAAIMVPINAEHMATSGDVIRGVARQARAHPVAALKLFAIKLARAWYGTDSQRLETYILLLQCFYIGLLLMATWRAGRLGRAPRELAILLWAVVLCFWAMNLLSLPLARYMTPAIGLLFLLLPSLKWPGAIATETGIPAPERVVPTSIVDAQST